MILASAKKIKERERRNKYLVLLKYLYCYVEEKRISDLLKLEISQEKEYADLLKQYIGKENGSLNKFIKFCREALFLKAKKLIGQQMFGM